MNARPEIHASDHGIVRATKNSRVVSCDSVEDDAVLGLNPDHPALRVVFLNRYQLTDFIRKFGKLFHISCLQAVQTFLSISFSLIRPVRS